MDRRRREKERQRKYEARQSQTGPSQQCNMAGTEPTPPTEINYSRKRRNTNAQTGPSQQCNTAGTEPTPPTENNYNRNRQNTNAQVCQAIDVHEHSFHGLKAEDVLNGELSIQMMDFISQILKAQFPSAAGLFAPSFLLGCEMSRQDIPEIKLNKNVYTVQIHFVNSHYLVSTQRNSQICVYDSLYNLQHLQSLKCQLQLLYKDVNINNVKYLVPQSQGANKSMWFLCHSNGRNASQKLLTRVQVARQVTHMYKCLKDASIQQFPQYSVQFHPNETVLDGEEPSPITFERTNSKLPGRNESNCQSTKKFMQSLQIRQKDRIRKQLKRSTEELKTKEREISKRSKQKLRTDPLNKQKDQQMSKQSKAKYREDPLNKQKDQQMSKQSMAKYRQDPLNKQKDQQMSKQSKAKYREDPLNKQKDQQMSKQSKAKYRQDPLNKQKDQQMSKQSKAKYREDPLNKQKDQQMTKQSMAKHREDPKAKDKDRERTRLIMQTRRLDKLVRDIEREKNRNYTRQKRQDPAISHKKTKKAHKNGHKTSTLKSTKQTANAKKAGKKRKCQHKSRREKNYQNHNTIESASAQFKNAVAKGCMFVCTCCHQMWFGNSVLPASSVKCDDEGLRRDCFTGKLSFDNKEWMCITCTTSIRKKKLPVLAYKNGMCFPKKPTVLELNSLEERLVAPVNPFMQLRELPSGGQVSIKGNVVNVPSDNVQTVTTLPRRLSECGTIPVKLKRRLRYKSHYMYANVRPEQCLEAVKYLLQKKLFQEYVVQGVDPQWLSSCSDQEHSSEWNEFIKQPP